jgi:retron-type reverse transcriptase
VERQFQQRQRELEQRQEQQLRSVRAFLKMILSDTMFSYESVFSYENLYRAYEDCRRTKRNTSEALRFEMQAEENLFQLHRELTERTFRPSTSTCFVTRSPKLREIFAADFRDRITHHLLVRYLESIWEPVFVYDSYASRPGKGIHLAVQRLQRFTRKVTHNGSQSAWYVQLDIKNFFMRINKQILFALIRSRCDNEDILWLAETLIFHDPTENYRLKSSKALLRQLPRQKSLFGTEKACGLPIGNLTSQFFANVYLNSLDQFIKHTLKCRFYMRYVDDLVLLHAHKAQLLEWQRQIERYLYAQLELTLNTGRTKLRPITNGIDFLGYIVRPKYVLCRNRVVNNLKAKLREFEQKLIHVQNGIKTIRYDHEVIENLFASLNSYLGHFKHANSFTLKQHLFETYRWLKHYFNDKDGKLKRLYVTPRGFWNLRAQYHYFLNRFYRYLIFFQVGCFYEFYGKQAVKAFKHLKLSMIPGKFGFRQRCGIGVKGLERYVEMALQSGEPVVVINQTGYMLHHVAERQIVAKYVPIKEEI